MARDSRIWELEQLVGRLSYQDTFFTRDQARQQIFEDIEPCYNGTGNIQDWGIKLRSSMNS